MFSIQMQLMLTIGTIEWMDNMKYKSNVRCVGNECHMTEWSYYDQIEVEVRISF